MCWKRVFFFLFARYEIIVFHLLNRSQTEWLTHKSIHIVSNHFQMDQFLLSFIIINNFAFYLLDSVSLSQILWWYSALIFRRLHLDCGFCWYIRFFGYFFFFLFYYGDWFATNYRQINGNPQTHRCTVRNSVCKAFDISLFINVTGKQQRRLMRSDCDDDVNWIELNSFRDVFYFLFIPLVVYFLFVVFFLLLCN